MAGVQTTPSLTDLAKRSVFSTRNLITKLNSPRYRASSAIAFAALLLAPVAGAQYKDYPQKAGHVQQLTLPQAPSWMSADLELRGRTEGQTAVNYISGNGQAYELTRVWGGMELRPTHWLTGYTQFMDSHALGMPLKYTASNMRDNFDLRQGYVELHFEKAAAFAGRQELKFGGERLVGISNWTNVSRTFDGVVGRFGGANNVTLFSASVVKIYPTSFDDHAGGLNFHGAYGSLTRLVPHTTIEPYTFIKALPWVKSQQSIYGTETEVTPGMRVLSNIPHGFEFIGEGVLQRGSFSNDSIHSGAGYVKGGYMAGHVPWTPRMLLEYDYATGNPHRNADRIGTFDQLYPSSHNAFGLVDLFGWQNIRQERIDLDLRPASRFSVLLQQEFLQTANKLDGVYSGSGSEFVKPPKTGFASDTIGRGFDASSKYLLTPSVVMNAGIAHFSPGAVMTENGHAAPLTIGYLSFTYRFRIDKGAAQKP
jgi:hypothetical protein